MVRMVNTHTHILQTDIACVMASTGTLTKHGAFQSFITDCIEAMRNKKRKMSKATKEFYITVLHHGGPMLHNWVSDFLFGASLSSSMKAKVMHYLQTFT